MNGTNLNLIIILLSYLRYKLPYHDVNHWYICQMWFSWVWNESRIGPSIKRYRAVSDHCYSCWPNNCGGWGKYVEAKLNHHKRLHIAIFRPLFCVITCKRSCTCAMINLIRPVFIFPSIHDLKTRPQTMKIDVWIDLFFLPFLTFHTIISVGQNGATVGLAFIVD